MQQKKTKLRKRFQLINLLRICLLVYMFSIWSWSVGIVFPGIPQTQRWSCNNWGQTFSRIPSWVSCDRNANGGWERACFTDKISRFSKAFPTRANFFKGHLTPGIELMGIIQSYLEPHWLVPSTMPADQNWRRSRDTNFERVPVLHASCPNRVHHSRCCWDSQSQFPLPLPAESQTPVVPVNLSMWRNWNRMDSFQDYLHCSADGGRRMKVLCSDSSSEDPFHLGRLGKWKDLL